MFNFCILSTPDNFSLLKLIKLTCDPKSKYELIILKLYVMQWSSYWINFSSEVVITIG